MAWYPASVGGHTRWGKEIVLLIADFEGIDDPMAVFSIVTRGEGRCVLDHLPDGGQHRIAKAGSAKALDREINVDAGRVEKRDGSIDSAPVIGSG